MIGQTISHYKILEKLGEGGMGVVYKAQDLKLKRTVALKFLPPELTRDPEAKERFIHEAQAASALQHNNICAIHDIDETADAQLFIVMDCYEGESLKERIGRGPLETKEATDIAIQIAQGLAEAHAHGIIHRDVKPANILITKSDIAKIVDFGLAKLAGQSRLTKAGSTLGTAAYMSPEQARGEEVDARTDIWSLGVVVYEMLTGHLPFRGEHEAALMYSIVHEEPQSLSDFRTDIPKRIASAIYQALQKDPRQRYQSALDLLNNFKVAMTPAIQLPRQEKSIVVLPFENLSADPEQEYFCDGMTEEIITDLSQIRSLRVISRNSAMMFKGVRKTTREIARDLNVQYMLEGSVRKAGNSLRVTAQLIDAATDSHLWAERYAGTLDDLFDIQEKVARAIADALRVKLSPDEQRHLSERPVSDARAYECYHRALHEIYFATKESFDRALRLLQQGLDTLGEHPILYMGLAQIHWFAIEFFLTPREEALRHAVEFTHHVEASDPEYAHALLAKLERFTGSQVQAIRHFEDAVAANPGDVDSHYYLSWSYSFFAGKPAPGSAVADRLISIDPLTVANLFARAGPHWADANFAQALAVFDDMHRREPGLRMSNIMRMHMLARLGRIGDACSVAEETVAENAEDGFAQLVTAFKHALLGEREPLLAIITGELQARSWNDPECPEWFAGWFALVNERDRALDWLEHWVDRGGINYPMLAHGDPLLEPLRGEERFKKLMKRVKYEWEHFEV